MSKKILNLENKVIHNEDDIHVDVNVDAEIKRIFQNNKLKDLKDLFSKRKSLNTANMVLGYFFHIVQSAGVFTTTIAAGYDIKLLVWVGVGLNIFASLINVYEKLNTNISKKMMKDIISIKKGTYIDEEMAISGDEKISTLGNKEKNEDYESDKLQLQQPLHLHIQTADQHHEIQHETLDNLVEPLIPSNITNNK